MLMERSGKKRTIWDELKPVPLDTQRIENLFENKAKDIMNKVCIRNNLVRCLKNTIVLEQKKLLFRKSFSRIILCFNLRL